MKKKLLFLIASIALIATIIAATMLPVAAAETAIKIGSGSVLFYSAPGVKSTTVGTLTPITTTSEALSVQTTIDATRRFTVYETSASTVIGGTLTFTYANATVGADEYISIIISDKTDKVLYYGKIKSVTTAADASGSVTMDVPALAGETAYNVHIFSERCTASGDIASKFSDVSLVVYPDPYITTTSIPATTQGVSYNYQLRAESSSSALTWSIVSGNLPNGLFINSTTGEIYGSPTKSGSFNFTVKASVGAISHKRTFTMKINPPLSIEFSSDASTGKITKIEVPLNRTVTLSAAITGGTPDYSQYQWQLDNAKINGATSLTYKVPTTKIGTYKYTFAVTDSATANATASITVVVRDPIVPKVSITTAQYDRAKPTNISFTKSDGDYPFSGKITAGVKTLVQGTDFTLIGNTVSLNKSLLDSLPLGSHTLALDYNDTTADPKIQLNIIDTSLPPEVGTIYAPPAIIRDEKLTLTPPTVTSYGLAIKSQGWKIKKAGATDFVNFDPTQTLDCSHNGASLVYYATNGVGTTTSNTVTIIVNHSIPARWQTNATKHWRVCACGEQFDEAAHTCTAEGDCTVCGYKCTHVYGSYQADNNASCTSDGTLTRYCIICNYRDSVVDPNTKLGHKWSIWQISDTQHWHVCTTCGTKSDEGAHVPGAPATYENPQVCVVCGTVLADKLSGGATTTSPAVTLPVPGTSPAPSDTTTAPAVTTTPAESDTLPTIPVITSPVEDYPVETPAETEDTTTPPPQVEKPTIIINRKDNDTNDDTPTFESDTDLSDVIIIVVDGRPLTKDEYTLSEDGKEITLTPATPIAPGKHTLTVETEDGLGETDFTIRDSGEKTGRRFPFWLLWVVPHVLADIAGLVLIIILLIKRSKDNEEQPNDDEGDDNISADITDVND